MDVPWRSSRSGRPTTDGRVLREHGCLGAVLVDLGPLAHIERSFGGATYSSLRSQIEPVLLEMKERFRQGDLLTRDEREGDRFLLFLGGRRNTDPSAPFVGRRPAQAGRPGGGVPAAAHRAPHPAL